ncbi:FAD-binding oxidoreductase [Terriglobus albidus]|uniref:FAD-binding oxidoreductase n=1 Tax=Terriglobus albidus TaxID=1592106 RepID=UPI0021E06AC4|nr:FAD-binding oxidoreductase [Terriglobus albidus]
MPVITHLAEHLAPLVGHEFVREDNGVFVVSPKDTHEVAAVIGFADHHGLKVRPTGGRTKLAWGAAAEPQIELSLQRLNQVVDHPWQDLTCTVQAGCTWETLQQTLARHGQFVALDPLWPATATVGGICATNDSGALRHRYGSLRDLVLGMTIVLADGTIARTGGRVVKNVAGYDLPKLMVGSRGTLAVITEVTFRLYALPRYAQSFTVTAEIARKLAALMQAIRDSHLATQALQLRGDASGFALDIQLNAHPEAKQEAMLAVLARQHGVTIHPSSPDVWRSREDLMNTPNAFLVKVTGKASELSSNAAEVVQLGGRCVAQAIGILYASFPNISQTYSALGSLYAHTDAGSMTVLSVPQNPQDDSMPPWGAKEPSPLTMLVKQQFDPNQTLNPLAIEPAPQPVR